MLVRSSLRLLVVALLSCGLPALAYSAGIAGYSGKTGGITCSLCHAADTSLAAPTAAITGPSTLAPGATGSYTLTLTGGPGIKAGLDVATDSATATLNGDAVTTQVIAGEVTHLVPRAFTGTTSTFNFSLVAPTTAGPVKLFAAGNSCNNNGGTVGDREALTTFTVTVAAPNTPPTVATAAAASPAMVTTPSTALSVLGADDSGEAALIYTWSSTGPASATFAVNGSNAAKNTVATFTKAGSYTFTVTVKDAGALTVTSTATVTVQAALAALQVAPATVGLAPSGTQQFTAAGADQFTQPLAVTPAWTVSGGGAISASGLFTAGTTPGGPFTVTATSGGKTGTAQVTVSAGTAPTIAQAAHAAVSAVLGLTVALTVLGADDGGEAALLYTWNATGPAPVTFSANGSNAAKNVTATFTGAGSYVFTATVRDAGALSTTSTVTVAVTATPTTISIAPASMTVAQGGTAQFLAAGVDQFRAPLPAAPMVTWSVAGGGTISSSGLFTAGSTPGGPFTVTATSGTLTATAQVSISAPSAPTLAQPPSAAPALVSGRSTALTVLGADAAGEPALRYHWSATGPAPATFSANDSNAAKNTTIAFTIAGNYHLTSEAKNAAGAFVDASIDVTVQQTLTQLAVSPATVTLAAAASQPFHSAQTDQFGLAMTTPVPVEWTVSGPGMIDVDGLFQAPPSSGGPWVVAGTANGVRGTALVTVGLGGPMDVSAPQVTLMNVATGSRISGAVLVSARVSDPVEIVLVELQLDGMTIASQTASPWQFTFDSTGYSNGSHTLRVAAHDAAGNIGWAPNAVIEIKNEIETVGAITGETHVLGCSAGPGALLLALASLLPALSRRRRAALR